MAFKLRLTATTGATYTHALGRAGVSVDKKVEKRGDGVPWLEIHTWTVNFRLLKDDGGPTLDTQITTLEEALRAEYTKAEMLYADDSPSATTLSGVRLLGTVRPIKPPSYTKYQGGEHVTYKTGTYQLEGIIKVFGSSTQVISLEEEVGFNPVGPIYGRVTPNVGTSDLQRIRELQPSGFSQSGVIVHAAQWGNPPNPRYTSGLLGPVSIRRLKPQRIVSNGTGGKLYLGCPTRYEYRFSSSASLTANPTIWT